MGYRVYSANEFAAHFKGDEKKALELFPRYAAGKEIDYIIKDRVLNIDILTCPSFSVGLSFIDVIIEDGRKPAKVIFDDVSFEVSDDGSYRMFFKNRLGENDAQYVFSFRGVKADIKLTRYGIADGKFEAGTNKLPWRIVLNKLYPLIFKAKLLGDAGINETEAKNMPFFKFMYIYLELYIRSDTHAAYGRNSIEYNKSVVSRYKLTPAMIEILMGTFPQIDGSEELMEAVKEYDNNKDAFFTEWCFYLSNRKGYNLYEYICNAVNECAENYESPTDGTLGAYYRIGECVTEAAAEMKLKGIMPHFIIKKKTRQQDYAFVYQRHYRKADANYKYIYLTILYDYDEKNIYLTPLVGSIISRGRITEELYSENGISCCFTNDGRERHFLLETEVFPKYSMKDVFEKWFDGILEKIRTIYS